MNKSTIVLIGLILFGICLVFAILLYQNAHQTQPLLESDPTQPVYVDDGVTFYPRYQSVNSYQNKVVVHLGWTEDDTQNQFLVWNPIVLMIWLVICVAAAVFGLSALDNLLGSDKLGTIIFMFLVCIVAIAYLMWYHSLYAAAESPILVGVAGVFATIYLALVAFVAAVLVVDSLN